MRMGYPKVPPTTKDTVVPRWEDEDPQPFENGS